MKSASQLIVRAAGSHIGLHPITALGDAGLRFLEFSILNLGHDMPEYQGVSTDQEIVLDVYAGVAVVEVAVQSKKSFIFRSVGRRDSVFSGAPEMVYLPPRSEFSIRTENLLKAGVFLAPSSIDACPAYVSGHEAVRIKVGSDNWTRSVTTSIGNNVNAERLIVGETLNPPGNWSSMPPHKHDAVSGLGESPMEEIYHFQIDPPQGFGIMRVYTPSDSDDPLDEALVVRHGDTVLIPRGYHPVVAAPGYQLHYTWALAGQKRGYGAWTEDPDHIWIKSLKPAVAADVAG